MTIEEIRQAKAEAEERIRQELKSLMQRTGMEVYRVEASFAEYYVMGEWPNSRLEIGNVRIDLRVP